MSSYAFTVCNIIPGSHSNHRILESSASFRLNKPMRAPYSGSYSTGNWFFKNRVVRSVNGKSSITTYWLLIAQSCTMVGHGTFTGIERCNWNFRSNISTRMYGSELLSYDTWMRSFVMGQVRPWAESDPPVTGDHGMASLSRHVSAIVCIRPVRVTCISHGGHCSINANIRPSCNPNAVLQVSFWHCKVRKLIAFTITLRNKGNAYGTDPNVPKNFFWFGSDASSVRPRVCT